MSPHPASDDHSLPVFELMEVDRICRQFEAACKAGQKPTVEAFLGETPEPRRTHLQRELAGIQRDLDRDTVQLQSPEHFLRNVVASGVMNAENLETFLQGLNPEQRFETAVGIAAEMCRAGKLTRFQAETICEGVKTRLVLGNYVLLDKLGQGGMGEVYKARHRHMDRVVALKILPSAATPSPDAVKRFQREVKAAANLSHPNIVMAHDAGEAEGVLFLVMEYVPGRDLMSLVRNQGRLTVGAAVDYVLQTARGLEYAHQQGVIHRDIKPANLLADTTGIVKILDMGLARIEAGLVGLEDGLTCTGQVLGTLDYLSPEQAWDAHHADARADIYSLGCTLYYLLTGEPPYRGVTPTEKLRAHWDQAIPSLREARPDVPADLEALFQQMLAKDPESRPRTMGDVIAVLQAPACVQAVQLERKRNLVGAGVAAHAADAGDHLLAGGPPHATPAAPRDNQAVDSPTAALHGPDVSTSSPGSKTPVALPSRNPRMASPPRTASTVLRWLRERRSWLDKPPRLALVGAALFGVLTIGLAIVIKITIDKGKFEWSVEQTESKMPTADEQGTADRRVKKPASGYAEVATVPPVETAKGIDGAAGKSRTLSPRSAETVGEVRRFEGHSGLVSSAAFLPDGKQFLSGGEDKSLRLWDVASGRALRVWDTKAEIRRIAISPDGRRALCGSKDNSVRLWDLETGHEVQNFPGHTGPVWSVVFSNNGRLALSGSEDGTVRLWEVETGREVRCIRGHEGTASDVAFSPDDRRVVSAGFLDRTVRVWDVETGREISVFRGHSSCVSHVAFCHAGLNVLSGSFDGSLRLWNVTTGDEIRRFEGHKSRVWCLAVSPDGKRVLSGASAAEKLSSGKWVTTEQESVRLWDIHTGQSIYGFEGAGGSWVYAVEFSPDGRSVLHSGENGYLGLYRLPAFPVLSAEQKKVTEPEEGKPNLVPPRNLPAGSPPAAIAPFDAAKARDHQAAWAAHLGVPIEFEDSIGMKFVLIPPGEFMMGSTPFEIENALMETGDDKRWQECIKSEAPQHKVILTHPFYLGVHEVTQAHYQKVMGRNPSHFAATGPGKDAIAGADTSTYPVEMVSWNDAVEFCTKLSEKDLLKPFYSLAGGVITMLDGTGYRLPTEAEWEFACRAGTTTKYWLGEKDEDLPQAGWIAANSGNRTHAVGELKASPFGLFDMHGNVWEWVQDRWEPTYYGQFQQQPAIDPGGPSSPDLPCVIRGGLCRGGASPCRASGRNAIRSTNCGSSFGFRAALAVDGVKGVTKGRDAKPTHSTTGWQGRANDVPSAAIAPLNSR